MPRILNSLAGLNGQVLNLDMDKILGTTVYDRSGNSNDGVNSGATKTVGKVGSALSFDGVDNYVSIASSVSMKIANALSIIAWIYPKSAGENTRGKIVEKNGTIDYAFFMFLGTSVLFASDDIAYAQTPSGSVPFNTWSHVAATFDKDLPANQINVYVNAVIRATATKATPLPTSDTPTYIGNRPALDRCFDGIIDEVRVYNRAISAAEIRRMYVLSKVKFWHKRQMAL